MDQRQPVKPPHLACRAPRGLGNLVVGGAVDSNMATPAPQPNSQTLCGQLRPGQAATPFSMGLDHAPSPRAKPCLLPAQSWAIPLFLLKGWIGARMHPPPFPCRAEPCLLPPPARLTQVTFRWQIKLPPHAPLHGWTLPGSCALGATLGLPARPSPGTDQLLLFLLHCRNRLSTTDLYQSN